MNRESFMSASGSDDVKTIDVTLPDGSTVKARKLTQAEVETIRRNYSNDAKALEGFRYIVSRTLLDDTGNRMLSDADSAKLAEKDFDIIQTIATEVIEFSGLKIPKT